MVFSGAFSACIFYFRGRAEKQARVFSFKKARYDG
jgi:hypothetical protein